MRRWWDRAVGGLAVATVVIVSTLLSVGTVSDTLIVVFALLGWCGVFCLVGYGWGLDTRRARRRTGVQ